MKLFSFFAKILDYVYWRKCYICSKKCSEISLCNNCIEEMYSNLKFHKAMKFKTIIYCGAPYENIFLKIIRALKYHQKSEFKSILSTILIKTAEHYELNLCDFVVCPVPIHKNRLKKRKYNHMELVAEEFAKHYNLEVDNTLLMRKKDTPPMYKLTINERKKQLDGAFGASEKIQGKKILLLDDIVTSGNTISELTKLIFEQNPKEVIVMCATRSNNCNF